jgi:hypothetical protein
MSDLAEWNRKIITRRETFIIIKRGSWELLYQSNSSLPFCTLDNGWKLAV